MTNARDSTTQLQRLIDGTLHGDDQAYEAYDALLERAYQRLRRLARAMLKNYPRLARWEETDDVLQIATMRLHRSLLEVRPRTAQHFFRLANTQIRRTLIDLARHYYGAHGPGANHYTDGTKQNRSTFSGGAVLKSALEMPEDLQGWTAFHEAIDRLPEREREAFEIVWYGGQTVRETAGVLGVSLSTVVRRLNRARLMLHQMMQGEHPDSIGDEEKT